MFLIPQENNSEKYNRPLYGLVGEYTLSEGVALPYFLTVMNIERAIEELSVAENIAPSLENKWSLQELFQREIDQGRVEKDIIRGYLKDPKKIKFFNAITIMLMPKNEDGRILEEFPSDNSNPPIPWDGADAADNLWNNELVKVVNFGGVQFSTIYDQARLRWDENKVLAVAVDGQHRLWALRTYKEDPRFSGGSLQPNEKNTKIPIIFILLNESIGFKAIQDREDHSIRTISRELFTDLNKNAKTVDKARELILDDKSINARCVRTLITDCTSEDSQDRLPLSLIRWQDDSNRFDSSYYLNSLVHLDLTISMLLELAIPTDPMDKVQVLKFIKSLNEALGIDKNEIKYEGRSIDDFYEEDCCDEDGVPSIPFVRLPENYLSSAVQGFEKNFRPWIIKVLLNFKPYYSLLQYAREHNLIEGAFSGYQAQTKKHKEAIKTNNNSLDTDWYRREILNHDHEIASQKKEQWAFKVIFQKALMRLAKLVAFNYKGDPNLGSINDLLAFLNDAYDRDVFKVTELLPEHSYSLWTFIALNPGNGKIKVAKTVEDNIYSLLCLWYFGTRKIKIDKSNNMEISSKRKLLNFFAAKKSETTWPNCGTCYNNLYKAINTAAFHGGKYAEMTDKEKEDNVKSRLADLLIMGVIGYEIPDDEADNQTSEDNQNIDLNLDLNKT